MSGSSGNNTYIGFKDLLKITALTMALWTLAFAIGASLKHFENTSETTPSTKVATPQADQVDRWESVPTPSVFWNIDRLRVRDGWLYSSRASHGAALCFVSDQTTTTANKE